MKTRKKTEKSGQQGTAPRTKIYVVEDHPVFREGMARLIAGEEDFILCGSAGDAVTAREEIVRLKPDLALVDIELADEDGISLAQALHVRAPATRIVLISAYERDDLADLISDSSAVGFVPKRSLGADAIAAVLDSA